MNKKVYIAAAAVLSLSMTACGAKSNDAVAPVQSVSMLCGYSSSGAVDRFAGIVTPRSTAEISKMEEQTVKELKVAVGDPVTVGQVLFTYDGDEAKLEKEKAELELEQMQNSVETKTKQKEKLEKEKAKAKSSEQLSYSLEIQELEMDIQETKYNIKVKEKEIQKMKDTMTNLDVVSTVDGVIQSINENGGTDDYGNPKPYITITETGSYRIKGYVNENNVGALQEAMSIVVRSRRDDSVWYGTLSEIDWEDPSTGNNNNYYYSDSSASSEMTNSSKYPFYVELESIDGLLLGQHVYIEPDYGQTTEDEVPQVAIASAFINDVDGKAWVWAESGKGKLEKRNVTLGAYDEALDTYIIESGLAMEDYIAYPDDSYTAGMSCEEYNDTYYSNDMGGDYGTDLGELEGGLVDDSGMIMEGEYTYEGEGLAEGEAVEEGEQAQEEGPDSNQTTGADAPAAAN